MRREISGGGGKPKVKFPEPSPEEKALQNEQVKLLREQRDILSRQMREQQLLAPFLYSQAGVKPTFDDKGEIVSFEEVPDELAPLRAEIERGFLDRTRAALAGELPVDPALLRDLREQEATLGESLRKQLGPGWQTSSAGQEGLQRFNESRNILLEGARRGDLTLAEQLGISRENANQQRTNEFLARLAGVSTQGQGTSAALGGVAAGYQNPLSNLFANRQGQFGARTLNFQYDAYADPFTWRGAQRNMHQGAMAFLSTAKAKKDIEPLDRESGESLKKLRDMPMFRYRYTWEGPEREPHIGPIKELTPKEIHHDEHRLNLADYLGLTTAAVKDLDREFRTLRDELKGGRR